MGIFDKLFKSRTIRAFVVKAINGPADCQIKISEIADLYYALADGLRKRGMTNLEIVHLVDSKLLGVCPKCYIATNGEWLSWLATIKFKDLWKKTIGLSSDAMRVMEGRCRNPSCACTEILIFWRPIEDNEAIDRLAKMGIVRLWLRDPNDANNRELLAAILINENLPKWVVEKALMGDYRVDPDHQRGGCVITFTRHAK